MTYVIQKYLKNKNIILKVLFENEKFVLTTCNKCHSSASQSVNSAKADRG